MKKGFLIFVVLFIPLLSWSQEVNKQKELGIITSGLNSFGLTYRTGTTNKLLRFNTLFASGSKSQRIYRDSIGNINSSLTGGASVGMEFRKMIVEKLQARYGAEISFSYSQSTTILDDRSIYDNDQKNKHIVYRPGLNLVLGVNYLINDHWMVGAEVLPGISYGFGKTINSTNNTKVTGDYSLMSVGLNNNAALLSLVYKF